MEVNKYVRPEEILRTTKDILTIESHKETPDRESKLVEYTNILKPLSVQVHLIYLYRKLLVSLFLFKKQSIIQYIEEIKLLQKYKLQIQNSRKINSIKQPSWL